MYLVDISLTRRDGHVSVFTGNIDSNGQSEYQRVGYATDYGVEYDYGSIMHYGRNVSLATGHLQLANAIS